MNDVDRIDVPVDRSPEPGFLRATIEAVLVGRPTAPGPEHTIALAVRDAVATRPRPATRPQGPPC
jgi:hypothetical protein